MKFNVEVEIDWVDEEGTLDEEVSRQIKDSLIQKIFSAIETNYTNQISEKVNEEFDNKIKKMYDDFLTKPFDLYDQYGDIKEKGVNIKKILKKKLDIYMNEKVDKYGKNNNWDGKARLQHILDDQAEKQIKTFLRALSDDIIEKLQDEIDEAARERITNAIFKNEDLKKVIGKSKCAKEKKK